MARPRQADLEGLLGALTQGGVEFVVVGGTAAVLHGAPTSTLDLDIVPRWDDANLGRLLDVLVGLEAKVRDSAGRSVLPTRELLTTANQLQLETRLDPLDLLHELHDQRGFEELIEHSDLLDEDDLKIRLLDLESLIEIKSSTGRARDKIVVPLLIAIRDRSDSRH